MRSIAVAADGGGLSEVPPGAIAGISTAVGAAIGGIALSLAQRYAGKAAWQQALNAGFKDLLDQVQKERERERQEHEADRLAWRQERIEYRGRITNLELTVRSLKDRMHQGGLLEDVRPDRYSPDPIITLTGDDD